MTACDYFLLQGEAAAAQMREAAGQDTCQQGAAQIVFPKHWWVTSLCLTSDTYFGGCSSLLDLPQTGWLKQ